MPIIYSSVKDLNREALIDLYKDAGWLAYTNEPDKLITAIQRSLYVLTAWDNEQLIGLIRVVGDGLTIIYIQDILVLKSYQRKGVGSKLINMLLDKYQSVRQKVLLTDDNNNTRDFYESMGFQPCDNGKLVAFAILEKDQP